MSCPTTIYSNVKANPTFWSASSPLPSIETVNQGNGSVKIFKNKKIFQNFQNNKKYNLIYL
jgi:hypothetical protein